MAYDDIIAPVEAADALPAVRKVAPADIKDALAKGLADFWAMPSHVIFLCWIYPNIGILLARSASGLDLVPLIYPIVTGFALIGPFAAIFLYELSRRREQGLETSWKHAFDIVHSPSFPGIVMFGLLLMLIFGVWVATAQAIYIAHFGIGEPTSLAQFATTVLTTPEGRSLIIVGNAVGFLFAVLAFTLSVVTFPLLLDRNVGAAVAIATSVKVVLANPLTMALWAVIVAAGLVIGSLPLLLGLVIVLPVLGHATWHLYRKAIEPDLRPRSQLRLRPKGIRYAAEFPASLFFSRKPDKE